MAIHGQDHPAHKHLAILIAKGEVRPSKGPRLLPHPIKPQSGDKTAVDWVSWREGVKPGALIAHAALVNGTGELKDSNFRGSEAG